MKNAFLIFISLLFLNTLLAQENVKIEEEEETEEHSTETMPEFVGGSKALITFLSKNLVYPKDALKKKKNGLVVIGFIIDTDGSIYNVKVVKSVYKSLDKEAMRVVKSMPNWIPGTQKGKKVKVEFNLPIRFSR